MATYKLILDGPGHFDIESSDGNHSKRLDLLEAYQKILDSEKSPNDDARWNFIRSYLATSLGCDVSLITRTQAHLFREGLIAAYKDSVEIAKKKLALIASSQQPFQESQTTTQTGPTG